MTSSNGTSEQHKNALLRKFQGNGWALTYSAKSQKQISALMGDKVGAEQSPKKATRAAAPNRDFGPEMQYKRDWADIVSDRSYMWSPEEGTAPLWLAKATEGADYAFFQLPAPDNRWVVKHAGKTLEPFKSRSEGWSELHEVMTHGHLLDRTESVARAFGVSTTVKSGDILKLAELLRPVYARDNKIASEDIHYSVTGNRLIAPDNSGTGKEDRWKTCVDDASKQLRDRMDRVLNAIKRKDRRAAADIKRALQFKDGQPFFSESAKWITAIGEIPHDATMILKNKEWEITFPDCNETLTVADGVAIRAIARLLMCDNSACPSALLQDGELLNEFLSRPRHHKYFNAIHRNPMVHCGESKNNEVERAICEAMKYKEGWSYRADHIISEESELHTVCGLPVSRVTLRRADALEGILNLLKQKAAKLFFCRPPSLEFQRILADIEAGIKFARKQEGLLQKIQPKSEEFTPNIQRAIHRLRTDLQDMGDWTTRFDILADHIEQYVRGGVVFQYTGPYRWKVEGIRPTPDSMDLASDHMAYKRRKVNRARRKAKLRFEALSTLQAFSKRVAAGL